MSASEHDRVLEVTFVLPGHDPISPDEFQQLFRCADDFARSIAQQESLDLMDELGLPSGVKLATVSRAQHLGRRVASPAQIDAVERGSWIVVMTISGSALLWVLKQYLHPVVLEAWSQSEMREHLLGFLQDRVFKSARRKAELKAAERSRYGNLQVMGVDDDSTPVRPSLTVHLERREIIEVRASDDLLIDEFLERLSRGR